MQRTNRLLFLLLCSGVSLLVLLLSTRHSLVIFSTKPFRTFALGQASGLARGMRTTRHQIAINGTNQTVTSPQDKRSGTKPLGSRPKPRGCVPPQIHPFDPSLKHVLESYPPLNCSNGLPSVVTYSIKGNNLVLTVDPSLVKLNLPGPPSIAPMCRYKAISVRAGGDFNTTSTPWSNFFTESILVGRNEEHFVVECYESWDVTSPLIAKSYISVVRERPALEKLLTQKLAAHVKNNALREPLNVILLGIDGMSKQNMIRTLPRTREFLLGTLHAKEMFNYNKNGMNTFPNVITLLTGKTVAEISSQYAWNTSKFFDSLPFIWDEFAGAGYRTQVCLDSSRVTSFHCSKQGFSQPPVHYYHRPLVLHSEQDSHVRHKDGNCIGDKPEVTLLLDYVLQMASVFGVPRNMSKSEADGSVTPSKQEPEPRNRRSGPTSVSGPELDQNGGDIEIPDGRRQQGSTENRGHHTNSSKHSKDFNKLHRTRNLQQQQHQQQQQQQHQAAVRPFFSYNFFVRLTHDNPQKASSGDELYRKFFSSLQTSGVLNTSVLIFFSDHGPRFGPLRRTIVGTMEDRMPFCLLVFPPWFLHKYPDVARVLTTNQNRLTSHFDIHATLRHILHFNGEDSNSSNNSNDGKGSKPKMWSSHSRTSSSSESGDLTARTSPSRPTGKTGDPLATQPEKVSRQQRSVAQHSQPDRGLSLLREIPGGRTCQSAGIDFQWCSCNKLTPVDTHDPLVRLLALEFALLLSDKTLQARHLCHQLNLANIRSAMKVTLERDTSTLGHGENPLEPDLSGPGRRFSKLLAPGVANTTGGGSNRDSSGGNPTGYHPDHPDHPDIYLLSIETKPGGAVFEGHIQFSQAEGSVRLLGTVLRLNMFQPQSMCVEQPALKPFCYCKDLETLLFPEANNLLSD